MADEVRIFPDEYRNAYFFYDITCADALATLSVIRGWLSDEMRPGMWTLGRVLEGHEHEPNRISLAITDPNVAFEFKMRFI